MPTEIVAIADPDASPDDEVTLRFVRPIAGAPFKHSLHYALRPLGPQYGPYASLVSLEQPDLCFVVAAPGLLFPDYVYDLPEVDQAELEISDASEVATLAIVRRRDVPVPVVNLRAPIVVNRRRKLAAQVLLDEACGFGLMVPVDAGSARWEEAPSCSS